MTKESPNIVILNVEGMTPNNLGKSMNLLYEQGYKLAFQSNIQWYQGKGDCGIIAFELQKGLDHGVAKEKVAPAKALCLVNKYGNFTYGVVNDGTHDRTN